jgi:sodium/potassium/calcium exchanger 6
MAVFAVGNSLADLVANVTVAQFAPTMAYAACFVSDLLPHAIFVGSADKQGGPMLNLLLGIGGSGTYHMLSSPHETPVTLRFSPTLWVSATGLVLMLIATAIFVPLNGYMIDRRWACCLIVAYIVVMSANVAVEIRSGRA